MSKKGKKRYRGKATKERMALPFGSENYFLFGIGLLLIVIGYVALSRGPWNSVWSLTLAPILLVLGYCVVIPVSILYRKQNKKRETEAS